MDTTEKIYPMRRSSVTKKNTSGTGILVQNTQSNSDNYTATTTTE